MQKILESKNKKTKKMKTKTKTKIMRAPKVPFNLHCEVEMGQTVFVNFNFILNLKIEKLNNFQSVHRKCQSISSLKLK